MPQEVMLYHSGQVGAPGANLAIAGGMSGLLDACLVNGFNVQGVATLTRSGTTATATTSGTHGFAVGEWVDVAGADQAAYNGRVKVTATPAVNQFTYEVTGSPATPATGTITARYGPAGWSKPHSGTNGGVYVTGAGSLGHAMQVEDDNPYADANASCRTRIVTGVSGFPDSGTQLAEQIRVTKGSGWVLVADHRTCYLNMNGTMFAFGEFASYLSGDLYAFFQSRNTTASAVTSKVYQDRSTVITNINPAAVVPLSDSRVQDNAGGNDAPLCLLRPVTQIAPHIRGYCQALPRGGDGTGSSAATQWVSPLNAADNALPLVPCFALEPYGGNMCLRARFRGVYAPLGQIPSGSFVNNVAVLDDVVIGGDVRKIAVTRIGQGLALHLAFDIGPSWG